MIVMKKLFSYENWAYLSGVGEVLMENCPLMIIFSARKVIFKELWVEFIAIKIKIWGILNGTSVNGWLIFNEKITYVNFIIII